MKLSALAAIAAVIGGSLFIPVSVEAQNYYGRTRPTFANPAGRSYTTHRNPNYNSFNRTQTSIRPMVFTAIAQALHAVDTAPIDLSKTITAY